MATTGRLKLKWTFSRSKYWITELVACTSMIKHLQRQARQRFP